MTIFRVCPALLCAALLLPTPPAAAQTTRVPGVDTKGQLAPILSTLPREGAAPTGWLPTALDEARVAATQALRATQAEDLAQLHQYAADVLHAIDPALASSTTGQGVGVRPAVQAIVQQLQVVAVPEATADVRALAPGAQTAAAQVLTWCQAVVETATAVRQASSVTAARGLLPTLVTQTAQLTHGVRHPGAAPGAVPRGTGGLLTLQAAVGGLVHAREAQARPLPPAATTAARPGAPRVPVAPPFVLTPAVGR